MLDIEGYQDQYMINEVIKMVECIICGGELSLNPGIELNEIIMCDDCGSELEVTNLDPFTVEEAPQEEEDWGE